MSNYVLDASAILALLNNEPGADIVQAVLNNETCIMSAVNWSEVAKKLSDKGLAIEPVAQTLKGLGLEFQNFDYNQAVATASLQAPALSLGDRACLSLAQLLGFVALSGDRLWQTYNLGISIQLIRP
ncbi:type II toxin-antitoxin system VapC family toxin [Synechocystis sp. PCC 7509]|uniref:type II toxin-antitoxin system VapC family toxin n=1 Tax=Synechocystis sp. PCC 7509 TaxID=927677 RepID=UPI0002AC699B|nr:type II toxin-antitoxin system VapC family toxin [Synechocystis sp. PCC 7509]